MLEDFLNHLRNRAAMESREEVGKVSSDIERDHKLFRKFNKRLDEDIELFKKQKEIEFNREIEERFGDKMDFAHHQHTQLWNRITEYLHLDPNNQYEYSPDNQTVYQVGYGGDDRMDARIYGPFQIPPNGPLH